MYGWPRSLAVLLLVAGACGSGDEAQPAATQSQSRSSSAAPQTTAVATTVPATTIPLTTIPATTVPDTTDSPATAPPTTTGAPNRVEQLAALLPAVQGYVYSDSKSTSVWALEDTEANPSPGQLGPVDQVQLDELAMTVTRPVVLEGGNPDIGVGWVGEVSIFDAGGRTPRLWMDFVDHHRIFTMPGPPPGDFYVMNTVPGKWKVIGNEIVMTGVAEPDGDFGAAWFHDGLIWAVSGWSSSSAYVEDLIAAQAATGNEPEQVDIDALEGALAEIPVNVGSSEFFDLRPADVLPALDGVSNCVQDLSRHYVSNDLGDEMWVDMMGFAAPFPCERGAFIIDDAVGDGATRQDINGVPAVISADGTTSAIVSDTGVVVIAWSTPEALQVFSPVLNALAWKAARTEI